MTSPLPEYIWFNILGHALQVSNLFDENSLITGYQILFLEFHVDCTYHAHMNTTAD